MYVYLSLALNYFEINCVEMRRHSDIVSTQLQIAIVFVCDWSGMVRKEIHVEHVTL